MPWILSQGSRPQIEELPSKEWIIDLRAEVPEGLPPVPVAAVDAFEPEPELEPVLEPEPSSAPATTHQARLPPSPVSA
jgi:hypothetical protein